METNWAAEHLQVIRTLMERSAVYRRALAPIMIFNGVLGAVGAMVGMAMEVDKPQKFIGFWVVVALVGMAGSFFLVRRQALKASEPFWSPPTRRVTQAMLPALAAGGIITVIAFFNVQSVPPNLQNVLGMLWLPAAWVVLYGCAFHAAGFFMPRGMKIFGWVMILGGCVAFACGVPTNKARHLDMAQGIMGFFFGGLHLAYGVYLYFTEKRRDET
jgi:hypothetical protein